LVDAHAHLDQYGEDLPRALAEIRARSLLTLSVSMDLASFEDTLRIAEQEPLVIPSLGIHPWNAPRYSRELSSLDTFLEQAPLLGEIGLDHFFVENEEEYPEQRRVFEYFLDAAEGLGRPVNIHSKGAEAEVAGCLEGRALPGIIIHWYSGPMEVVSRFLDAGAYFTIGVEVFRSARVRELARALPSDRLLTETDNPGAWEWMEGSRGYPHLIERVYAALSELRETTPGDLKTVVRQNTIRLLEVGGVDVPDAWETGERDL
jgi:TatD DNase family protein